MPADERLNVLVVMSDEQRWDTFGYTGNPAAHTPHLDALAEESTNFDRTYTPFPLCCPSRSSLWTGRMPRHHHVLGNWRGINPELCDTSLATAFKAAGYHTIYNGKWHVPGTTPQRMGFDDCTAIPAVLNGQDRGRYIEPYRKYVTDHGYELVNHIENLTPGDLKAMQSAHRGTAEIQLEHYLEPWQTNEFLRSLDNRPDDRPWFAATSFNAPHFPMIVPEPYDQLIDRAKVRLPESFASGLATKPKEVVESGFATRYADLDQAGWTDMIAHYLGMCALVDAQVGAIVEHLRRTGQLDRTIIVYTTDHGDMMGAHRLMEKGHLLHYEESLRVPLLVRHPDALAATSTRNLVSVVDFAQSLSDLAGVQRDEDDDGRSFADMVGNPDAQATRTAVTAETVLYNMDSETAHGEHVDPATWDATTDAINLSVRTDGIRYVYRSRDIDELYDHRSDPHEQLNVAADPAYEGERKEARRLLAAEVHDVFPQVANTLIEVPASTPSR